MTAQICVKPAPELAHPNPRGILALSFFAASLTFLPATQPIKELFWLSSLGTLALATLWGPYAAHFLTQRRLAHQALHSRILSTLTPTEKQLVWTYVFRKSDVLAFIPDDPIPQHLASRSVLKPALLPHRPGTRPYRLCPWVLEVLKEHPVLVQSRAFGPYPGAL